MVIFIGDKPGKKNKSSDAFVGASCYPRLLSWIAKLDLSINNVFIFNQEHIKIYSFGGLYCQDSTWHTDIDLEEDRIIALGKAASKGLTKLGVDHFTMPHPSGLNRQLNSKSFIELKLQQCKYYIDN